jgi:hypothetical protein
MRYSETMWSSGMLVAAGVLIGAYLAFLLHN